MNPENIEKMEELLAYYRKFERQVSLIDEKIASPVVLMGQPDYGRIDWLHDTVNAIYLTEKDLAAFKEFRLKEMDELKEKMKDL